MGIEHLRSGTNRTMQFSVPLYHIFPGSISSPFDVNALAARSAVALLAGEAVVGPSTSLAPRIAGIASAPAFFTKIEIRRFDGSYGLFLTRKNWSA